MVAFALAVLLGSFLNFLVQPLMGRYILPWYGGTPGVWTVCLLFFQLMLVVGYAYAHLISGWLPPRRQVIVHLAAVAASFAFLPLVPDGRWRTIASLHPTLQIILLLGVSVGLPYLILSASAPLVQSWFSTTYPHRSPYRLYALSNVASLGALLAYPLILERSLALPHQTGLWSAIYVIYAVSLVLCGMAVFRSRRETTPGTILDSPIPADARPPTRRIGAWLDGVLWVVLSMLGSVMLMACTNQLTQDVMPVPFLWVLPLGIYLLTFIICFDRPEWYHRTGFTWFFIFSVIASGALPLLSGRSEYVWEILIYSATVFSACMCCHGELVARRPDASHLTHFYLAIAVGGALGGLLVAVAAPALLNDYREFTLGTIAVCLALLACRRQESIERALVTGQGRLSLIAAATAGVLVLVAIAQLDEIAHATGDSRFVSSQRNFYGVLALREDDIDQPERAKLSLSHGTTVHGFQFLDARRADEPTSYFDWESGVGRTVRVLREIRGDQLRIGVIGLGAGTLAAYGRPGDTMVFYEINPLVKEIADQRFSFLKSAMDRGARIDVRVGDARQLLEQELAAERPGQYDLLIVDAFTGDSIPVHLLTSECFDMYQRHLAENGVLAVHISNRYLNLEPVVAGQARRLQRPAVLVKRNVTDAERHNQDLAASDWIVTVGDARVRAELLKASDVTDITDRWQNFPLWTDSYSSLFGVLR